MQPVIAASVLASILSAAAIWPSATIAANKCDDPRSEIDRRACAKASEGPDVLRRFVWRTQPIWNLYYWDYAPRAPQTATVRRGNELRSPVDATPKVAASGDMQ